MIYPLGDIRKFCLYEILKKIAHGAFNCFSHFKCVGPLHQTGKSLLQKVFVQLAAQNSLATLFYYSTVTVTVAAMRHILSNHCTFFYIERTSRWDQRNFPFSTELSKALRIKIPSGQSSSHAVFTTRPASPEKPCRNKAFQTLVIILLHSFNQHTKLNEPVRKLNIQKFVCEEFVSSHPGTQSSLAEPC